MSHLLNEHARNSALDDYRLTSSVEILNFLRQVETSRTLVTLSDPSGHSYTTLLWDIDSNRGMLRFSGDGKHEGLLALLQSSEVTAVAYLDSIKLQFDVESLVLVHGDAHEVVSCSLPKVMYRFQRRSSFRVTPALSAMPTAQFAHPHHPDLTLSLRVVDVSLGGIALFLPDDMPDIADGTRIPTCSLRLDDSTWLDVSLIMRHETPLLPESRGARLGCEFVNLHQAERDLQFYINQTQKRQLALAARKV